MQTEVVKAERVHCQLALQVRLGSQRLPRKALLPLAGGCVLDWVLYHLCQSCRVERFLLLCPQRDCEALARYAHRYGFILLGGSEQDVLQRFSMALNRYPAQLCFRVTGDNPLVHGSLLDFMLKCYECGSRVILPDYYWIRGLPYGLAAELFCSDALLSLEEEPFCRQLGREDREHVTRFLYRHPEQFRVCFVELSKVLGPKFAGLSEFRLTLDTADDYRFLQKLFISLQKNVLLPAAPRFSSHTKQPPKEQFFRQFLLALRDLI